MNSSRCECLIHWSNTNVNRCAAMVHDKEISKYCYYHDKVFSGLALSSPKDMKPEGLIDKEFIVRYTSLDGGERKENRDERYREET